MNEKKCVMCGGEYVDMNIHNPTDLNNSGLGLKLVGRAIWRAVECNRCGNIQVFRLERNDEQMRSGTW